VRLLTHKIGISLVLFRITSAYALDIEVVDKIDKIKLVQGGIN
jgi:hypothetical protein